MNYKDMGKYDAVRHLYEKSYEFRFCKINEIDKVEKFIDNYWQKGHIFTKSKELLDWQHLDVENERYNFVLAIHKKTGEIHALVGFIMSNLYDREIAKPIRWGAIWKIREDVGAKGLGIAVKWFFEQNASAPYIGGVGLSNDSKRINKKLGEKIGVLNHFYILNANRTHYKLIENCENVFFPQVSSRQSKYFAEVLKDKFERFEDYYQWIPPFKSPKYYVNRYFNHPIYEYHFTEIRTVDEGGIACFVWRKAEHEGNSCIFIVDYIGNGKEMLGCYGEFQQLLISNNAEYISFYNYGFKEEYFYNAGFRNVKDSNIIVPMYFEPFVKKNVELDYHYYANDNEDNCEILFKGDADQDRPNQI
ncbi:hypothetical protein ACFQ3W_21475 [Paenibacillus puldeungensis]|uniref:N-acetyltransferase domain-containing protein n=1 Tax=Paenibacillus puldeungensis TaxID=696536 RepID=A0ABW3S242_9BACL